MTDTNATKIKVLVIDDDDLVRDTLEVILESGGFEVELVSGGFELEEKLKTFVPDVLITDIFMPRMDGIEVIREVRKTFPHIKIIAMSGTGHVENAEGRPMMLEMAKGIGATASIQKPFRPKEITDIVTALAGS